LEFRITLMFSEVRPFLQNRTSYSENRSSEPVAELSTGQVNDQPGERPIYNTGATMPPGLVGSVMADRLPEQEPALRAG
jgi:hypothetical protein